MYPLASISTMGQRLLSDNTAYFLSYFIPVGVIMLVLLFSPKGKHIGQFSLSTLLIYTLTLALGMYAQFALSECLDVEFKIMELGSYELPALQPANALGVALCWLITGHLTTANFPNRKTPLTERTRTAAVAVICLGGCCFSVVLIVVNIFTGIL